MTSVSIGAERELERELERSTLRVVARRLLPFLILLLIVNFLDRTTRLADLYR